MKTPDDKLAKIYTKHLGQMTKMAAMTIFGKNLLNFFLQNKRASDLETWNVALGMWGISCLFK